MRGRTLAALLVAGSLTVARDTPAQRVSPPYLIADLDASASLGSLPDVGAVLGGRLLFGADDGQVGRELWSTDGTPGGTALLADIFPGAEGSNPSLQLGVRIGGRVVFAAGDSLGREPWVTDGTPTGTVRLRDAAPGEASSSPHHFTALDDVAYFTAWDPHHGRELWRTDGMPEGTQLVIDLLPGTSGLGWFTTSLAPAGGWLYLATENAARERSFWRTNGTADGTTLVAELDVVLHHELAGELVVVIRNEDGSLSVSKLDALDEPVELGSMSSGTSVVSDWLATEDTLYLAIYVSGTTTLWRTDGTAGGTQLLATSVQLPGDGLLGEVGGELAYVTLDASDGSASLRLADGSPGGTLLRELLPACSTCRSVRGVELGGYLYFFFLELTSDDFFMSWTSDTELWRTDGTPDGTELVVAQCCSEGYPLDVRRLGSELVFLGFEESTGAEPWISDGTAGGTRLLRDIHRGTQSSQPRALTDVDGTLFFGTLGTNGANRLWTSDGTAAGTVAVLDLTVAGIVSSEGRAVLSARDGASGLEIWTSDGTPGGTQVLDVLPGPRGLAPSRLTDADGLVYFHGTFNVPTSSEPWVTDGTVAGTVLLADITRGGSAPSEFTPAGGTVYFAASDWDTTGRELWKTDGTQAGTQLVIDLTPGSEGTVEELTALEDDVCFISKPLESAGLWCSDGTAPGTRLLLRSLGITDVHAVGDTLFFVDACEGDRKCLYRSDGTATGWERLHSFDRVSLSSVATLDGVMYFAAGDGLPGLSLWRTDGTPEGTSRVKWIVPWRCSSSLWGFTQAHGLVFFAAWAESGLHLWMSDGTAPGTRPLGDAFGPALFELTPSGTHVFFVADDGQRGVEPWAVDLDPDGDGAAGVFDNCPATDNPSQADVDGDGHGDACDACAPGADADADNACDADDNCPDTFNPLQADLDGDGSGDACDADADGDGVPAEDDCDDMRADRRQPTEVTNLRLAREDIGLRLTWDGQDDVAGSDVRYTLVSGQLPGGPWREDQLESSRCLASQVVENEYRWAGPGELVVPGESHIRQVLAVQPGHVRKLERHAESPRWARVHRRRVLSLSQVGEGDRVSSPVMASAGSSPRFTAIARSSTRRVSTVNASGVFTSRTERVGRTW